MPGVLLVLIGLLAIGAALWTVDPLWSLIPSVAVVAFGLWLDEDVRL